MTQGIGLESGMVWIATFWISLFPSGQVDAFQSLKLHLEKSCYSWKSRNQTNQDGIHTLSQHSNSCFTAAFYWVWKGLEEIKDKRLSLHCQQHTTMWKQSQAPLFRESLFYMEQLIVQYHNSIPVPGLFCASPSYQLVAATAAISSARERWVFCLLTGDLLLQVWYI